MDDLEDQRLLDPLAHIHSRVRIIELVNGVTPNQKKLLEDRILHVLANTGKDKPPMRWSNIPRLVKKEIYEHKRLSSLRVDDDYITNITDQLLFDMEKRGLVQKSIDACYYWIK